MSEIYNVFLDDERIPKDVKWIELPLVEWTIIRNYDRFVETIKTRGIPNVITFDHDLHPEHYEECNTNVTGVIDYSRFKHKTGYDCAFFFAQQCIEQNKFPKELYIHTLNPIGKRNIHKIMTEAYMELMKNGGIV